MIKYIILLVIIIVVLAFYEHYKQQNNKETMAGTLQSQEPIQPSLPLSNEALQNIASIYNNTNMATTNLTVTGKFAIGAEPSKDRDNSPYIIPKGVIVVWSGQSTNIPFGWALCDGSNGTPDLRGKFVMGFNNNSSLKNDDEIIPARDIGTKGGREELRATDLPLHAHGIPRTMKVGRPDSGNDMWKGNMNHGYGYWQDMHKDHEAVYKKWVTEPQNQIAFTSTNIYDYDGAIKASIDFKDPDLTKLKNVSSSATTSNTSRLPPFYVLAYIMKL